MRHISTWRLLVVAASLSLAGAGCAVAPAEPVSANSVFAGAKVESSDFEATATVVGPLQSVRTQRGLLSDRVDWRVRVIVNKEHGFGVPQLYVSIWHQDRHGRRYERATLLGGEQLRLVRIHYDPQCSARGGLVTCTHTEVVGASLTPAAWQVALADGLPIQLAARSGDRNVITVPAEYAKGLEQVVNARGWKVLGPTWQAQERPKPTTLKGAATPQDAAVGRKRGQEEPAYILGPDSHALEKLPEAMRCDTSPVAKVMGKAPGDVFTYVISCSSGDALTYRCQYGKCTRL